MAHDRPEEAREILSRLRLKSDIHDTVSQDLADIQNAIIEERAAAAGNGFRALTKDGEQRFRYRTLLGIGGQFMQQLSGISKCSRLYDGDLSLTKDARSHNLLRPCHLRTIRRPVALSITTTLWLQWHRLLLLITSTNLDTRSPRPS